MQTPELTRRERLVLLGAYRDLLENLSIVTQGYGFIAEKRKLADAQDGVVRTDPGRWFPHDERPDKNQVSNIYKELAALGLVERLGQFLRFTKTGRELAQQLLSKED